LALARIRACSADGELTSPTPKADHIAGSRNADGPHACVQPFGDIALCVANFDGMLTWDTHADRSPDDNTCKDAAALRLHRLDIETGRDDNPALRQR